MGVENKQLDALIEKKREETGCRYPVITDDEMNAIIDNDPSYVRLMTEYKMITGYSIKRS